MVMHDSQKLHIDPHESRLVLVTSILALYWAFRTSFSLYQINVLYFVFHCTTNLNPSLNHRKMLTYSSHRFSSTDYQMPSSQQESGSAIPMVFHIQN